MKKILLCILLSGIAGNHLFAMEDPQEEVIMEQMIDEAKKEALEALERGEDPFTSPRFQELLQMQRSQLRKGEIATPTRALKKIHRYTQSFRPITANIKLWLGMYKRIQENALVDNEIHDIIITPDGKYFIAVYLGDTYIFDFENREIGEPIKILEADFTGISVDGKYVYVEEQEQVGAGESERAFDLEKGDFVNIGNIEKMPPQAPDKTYWVEKEPNVFIAPDGESIYLPAELRLGNGSMLAMTQDEKYFVICRYPDPMNEEERENYDAEAFVDVYAFDDDRLFERTTQDGLNLIAELYKNSDDLEALKQILKDKQQIFDSLPIQLQHMITEKLSQLEPEVLLTKKEKP